MAQLIQGPDQGVITQAGAAVKVARAGCQVDDPHAAYLLAMAQGAWPDYLSSSWSDICRPEGVNDAVFGADDEHAGGNGATGGDALADLVGPDLGPIG